MKKDNSMSQFSYAIWRVILRFLAFFFVGYRHKDNFKIKKGESIVVLSNHQTDIDAVLINLSFNRLLHTLTTDNLFKKGFANWILTKFGAIPKRKGMVDPNSTMQMMRVIKNHQSLLIFPEGNRAYAEFQYYISPRFVQFLKAMKAKIVLFNLHGGNGTHPRFMRRKRRGKFYGEVTKVLAYEEYKDMPDEELFDLIKQNLRVFDSESGALFKDKRRAEYLERMFFVCPSCHSAQTLYSKRELIRCQKCGFEAEFTEDLHLKIRNSQVNYTKLVEWYNYQKVWMKELEINNNEPIFTDENVKLFSAELNQKKTLLAKGKLSITNNVMTFDNVSFDIKDIEIASSVSGTKFVFTHLGKNYEVRGAARFNPLKYVMLFNKLDTKMHLNDTDKYFNLEVDV